MTHLSTYSFVEVSEADVSGSSDSLRLTALRCSRLTRRVSLRCLVSSSSLANMLTELLKACCYSQGILDEWVSTENEHARGNIPTLAFELTGKGTWILSWQVNCASRDQTRKGRIQLQYRSGQLWYRFHWWRQKVYTPGWVQARFYVVIYAENQATIVGEWT